MREAGADGARDHRMESDVETATLFEERVFDRKRGGPLKWGDDKSFRYCTFEDTDADPYSVDGAIVGSTLERVDLCRVLFNGTLAAATAFSDCVFRGCSMSGVELVACTFERCLLVLDNQLGACTSDDCLVAEGRYESFHFGLAADPEREALIARTRFCGCRQSATTGVEQLF